MSLRVSLLITPLLIVVGSAHALAVPPQRCNGVVQFRPCGQPLATGKKPSPTLARVQISEVPRFALPHGKSAQKDGDSYAEILSQSMAPLAQSLGQWRGTLRGNGTVHLRLLWYKNGLLSAARSMGVVKLSNKATNFAFRSTFPPGSGWTWKVAAYATESS